jgi:hypothetical protein
MGVLPFFSIGCPQQEHDGVSFTSSLPGTESMRGGVGYLLDDVSTSSVRTASLSSPVCTNPSRCEGIERKAGASLAWEMAGSWAAGDATLVSALHPCSGLYVAMQDSRGWPLFCLCGHYASGTGPQLLGSNQNNQQHEKSLCTDKRRTGNFLVRRAGSVNQPSAHTVFGCNRRA